MLPVAFRIKEFAARHGRWPESLDEMPGVRRPSALVLERNDAGRPVLRLNGCPDGMGRAYLAMEIGGELTAPTGGEQ